MASASVDEGIVVSIVRSQLIAVPDESATPDERACFYKDSQTNIDKQIGRTSVYAKSTEYLDARAALDKKARDATSVVAILSLRSELECSDENAQDVMDELSLVVRENPSIAEHPEYVWLYRDGEEARARDSAAHAERAASAAPVASDGDSLLEDVWVREDRFTIEVLLGQLITDEFLNQTPRAFDDIIHGLVKEYGKEREVGMKAIWKTRIEAFHARYTRIAPPELEVGPIESFLQCQTLTDRLDARVIPFYARSVDRAKFDSTVINHRFATLDDVVGVSEDELHLFVWSYHRDSIIAYKDCPMFYVFSNGVWREDERLTRLSFMVSSSARLLCQRIILLHMKNLDAFECDGTKASKARHRALEGRLHAAKRGAKAALNSQYIDHVVKLLTATARHFELNACPFNKNPFTFSFSNCTFDLETGKQVVLLKYDCSILSSPHYYMKPSDEATAAVKRLFDTILTNTESRKMLLSIFVTGMVAQRLNKWVFFQGGGGNGKDVVNEFFMELLGREMAVMADPSLLTSAKTSGPMPELHALDMKRYVYFSEVAQDAAHPIRDDNIKRLTGVNEQGGRNLYSNNSSTTAVGTTVISANTLPKITGVKGNEMLRRCLILEFDSTFTDDEAFYEKHKHTNKVFRADPIYTTTAWRKRHVCALFDYLMAALKTHKFELTEIYMTPASKKRAAEYLLETDDVPGWVNEHYTLQTGDAEAAKAEAEVSKKAISVTDFIPVSSMYKLYQTSDSYQLMTKAEKRAMTAKRFKEILFNHTLFGPYCYSERKAFLGIDEQEKRMYNTSAGLGFIRQLTDMEPTSASHETSYEASS